jgi:hypothetical protein
MTPDELLRIALDLVDMGAQRGVMLRLLGSLGARAHSRESAALLDTLGREPTHDIDFMGYSSQQIQATRMFRELGYEPDPSVAFSQEYGIQRLIFHKPNEQLMAEVFLDVLRMAHTLDFRGRLELDSPSVSLVDLLLSKLQIQQITEKDIKDMIALLAEHALGSGGQEVIDVPYLLELTSQQWGLYYTARTNLSIVSDWAERTSQLDLNTRQQVREKVSELIRQMDAAPKSLRWRLRSSLGTRVRWYDQVDDVHRGGFGA